ncbi:LuxR family transcriptional regulator [Spongiactinospora sp. TRM90649]|uniref:LuxR C-terminal-related transcriptional regulator n=1 Tax=Spongiactinospora sp. TRM90649 TaxID=3031114 RepID=UPI0023FA02AD|nr:LuxR family transcriptional regulator [Spongiactinospora sp. TRM90649]MDF5757037.1 LuxR C-terminal-related transcriptional regulator [Spongiactinospora sp. TRM90649]
MKTWPFAGRRQELETLIGFARDRAAGGVVIVGAAGVGKSRLAAEVLRRFADDRFTVLRVRATKATSGIPNGALADLLPRQAPEGNTLRWAAEEIVAHAGGRRLVLGVDDAHLLDGHSAGVIRSLVATGRARVVATLRSGEPAPDGVTALWRDHLARRADIGPLGDDDIRLLLTAALAGRPDEATVLRLCRVTEGNALFLHEIVDSALASGTLQLVRGMWQLTRDAADGDLAAGAARHAPLAPRLVELIRERIGTLSAPLAAVLEFTAFAEPIGARTLSTLVSEQAVLLAEERGLIRVVVEGSREVARLGHPLYGEVARERCPGLRRRRRHADLVRVVEAAGLRRREDLLRSTVWRLESGLGADPEPLIAACRLAWGVHDYPLAVRLAEAALAAGGGIDAAILLANLLDYAQLPDRARAVLDATPEPADETTRAQLALARASNLAWGMDRLPEAMALLERTEGTVRDRSWRGELAVRRITLAASAADPRTALDWSAPLLVDATDEDAGALPRGPLRAQALNAHALALCYAGRTAEARERVAEALADASAWRDTIPALVSPLHSTWSLCGLFSGDLTAMGEATASMAGAVSGQRGWSRGEGSLALARGHAAILRGDLDTALAVLHAPAHHETAVTVGGCMGAYALAQALCGEGRAAQETLDAALARNRASWTGFGRWVTLTRVWIAAALGETTGAADLALRAAAECRAAGLPGFEFVALHDAVRLGRAAAPVVARLAELARVHDGERVRLAARHAAALSDGDGAGLMAAANGFERLGLMLHAAEAAAQATGTLRRAGDERGARRAAAEAWSLAAACPRAGTPALRFLAAPDLTDRELEVAQLGAAGRSHREVAESLHISLRTAQNHRNQAYQKLGVNSAAELAGIFARFNGGPLVAGGDDAEAADPRIGDRRPR